MAGKKSDLDDHALVGSEEGPRSRRALIIRTAIDHFGKFGYDETKWSVIAVKVGIGQPALYHYYESKAHCLLFILRLALERSLERVTRAAADSKTATEAVDQALKFTFDVSDFELRQLRILQNNLSILATPRSSPVEEEQRIYTRRLVRKIELAWSQLLKKAMAEGAIPKRDAHLLARTILGIITSTWRWYRPDGPHKIEKVGKFTSEACRRVMVG